MCVYICKYEVIVVVHALAFLRKKVLVKWKMENQNLSAMHFLIEILTESSSKFAIHLVQIYNIHFITLNWSAHQSVSKWKLAALLFLEYSFGKHLSCNFRGKQSINQKVNCFDLVKGKLNCHSTMKFSKCAIITCLHNMVSVNNNLNPV